MMDFIGRPLGNFRFFTQLYGKKPLNNFVLLRKKDLLIFITFNVINKILSFGIERLWAIRRKQNLSYNTTHYGGSSETKKFELL